MPSTDIASMDTPQRIFQVGMYPAWAFLTWAFAASTQDWYTQQGIPSMVLTIRDILDWTGLPLVPTSLSQVLSFVKNSFNKIFHLNPYSS